MILEYKTRKVTVKVHVDDGSRSVTKLENTLITEHVEVRIHVH